MFHTFVETSNEDIVIFWSTNICIFLFCYLWYI